MQHNFTAISFYILISCPFNGKRSHIFQVQWLRLFIETWSGKTPKWRGSLEGIGKGLRPAPAVHTEKENEAREIT